MTPESARILSQIIFDLYGAKKALKDAEPVFVGTLVLPNPRGGTPFTLRCGKP